MKIVMIGGWWGKVGHFFGVVGWWWWWRSRKASGGGGWWGKGGQFGNLLGWKSTARSKELRRKSDSLPRCTEKENIEIGFLKVTIFYLKLIPYIFFFFIFTKWFVWNSHCGSSNLSFLNIETTTFLLQENAIYCERKSLPRGQFNCKFFSFSLFINIFTIINYSASIWKNLFH